jgi:diguanylate cyclase (GGDEF)-like protein/putative nucleotidyltransferase with HDIG domain
MTESRISKFEAYTEKVTVGLISVVGLCAFLYAIWNLIGGQIDTHWLLLGVVTLLVVSRLDTGMPNAPRTITISDSFIFTSLLLYGLWPSVVLAGFDGAFCSLYNKERRKAVAFDAGLKSISILVAGMAAQAIFPNLEGLTASSGNLFLAAGLIAMVHYLISAGTNGALGALKQPRNRTKRWAEYFVWSSIPCFAGAVAASLIVMLISSVSFYGFILAVAILAFSYLSHKARLRQEDPRADGELQMGDAPSRSMEALAIAAQAREGGTREHVRRVQIYSEGLAKVFGLAESEIEALKAASILHDIGKVAVPDYILNKPGPLTPSELERMKSHVTVGTEILETAGLPYPVVPVVRHHHERWDGRGYPDGLKGDQIPMTARILTLVDCFDTLREQPQHGQVKPREEAIAVIRGESGKTFDPEVVRVFLEHLTEFEAEIRWQQVDFQPASIRKNAANPSKVGLRVSDRNRDEKTPAAYRELTALYEVATNIPSAFDFRDTFALLSARLEDIVGYTTCVLYLLPPGGNDVEVAFVIGLNLHKLRGKKMPPGAGIAGWVVANEQSMHNCDPRLDFNALEADISEQYLTATVVPLQMEGRTTGALAVYSAEISAYTPEHLRLIEAVVRLLSDSFGKAAQHDPADANTLTDAITGLPNARALRHRFEDEAGRAQKHNDTFALVMMDLDGFNTVNEQLGHQAGDMILRQLSLLLTSQIRASDFISRYGSDEFVAVLQAGPDEIVELAGRIQRAVDRKNFGPTGASIFIGVSVGSACFGTSGSTFDELLLAADRDMRADKLRRKALLIGSKDSKEPIDGQFRIM